MTFDTQSFKECHNKIKKTFQVLTHLIPDNIQCIPGRVQHRPIYYINKYCTHTPIDIELSLNVLSK